MAPVAQYFVGTRSLDGFQIIDLGDGLVVDQYVRLVNVLTTRCGSQIAGLFAEPHISYGNGKAPARIDWYTRYDGPARPLDELDSGAALAVRRTLTARLAALRPLCFDPEFGPLVSAALNIADSRAILSIGGEPVLIDWGMLPQAVASNDRSRIQQFRSTLAPYLPDLELPPISRQEWEAQFSAQNPASPPLLDRSPAAAPPPIVSAPHPTKAPSLLAPAIAAGIAAIVLGVAWIPGVLAFPGSASPESAAALATAQEVLKQLRIQRAKLDEAIQAPCPALLENRAAETIVPPPLENVRVTPPAPPAAPGSPPVAPSTPSTFVSRVNDGTVLVMTQTDTGRGLGSGFFVSSNLIVTNRHVVEKARRVRVASSVIGLIDAEILSTGNGQYQDFALLKVTPQTAVKPFELAAIPSALQQVVAVGYPAVTMDTDPTFLRLKNGDATASRTLAPVTTIGPVNHLQRQANGVTLVVHGAEISRGNSGGPLVDLCGRVVGINTFYVNDHVAMWRYALGSDGIKSFVERAGGTVQMATGQCTPNVASAPPPAAGTDAPTSTPPAPASPAPATTPPSASAPR